MTDSTSAPFHHKTVSPIAALAARTATRAGLIALFALLTWISAKISVPLPWTPVPGTLQTLAVLLAGAVLGARAGAASQIAYLSLGMAGLPVFALPGAGPFYFAGPTGGYLAGFVAGAFLTGCLASAMKRWGTTGLFLAFLAGGAAIHAVGLPWLAFSLGGDPGAALRAGLLPFLLFDLAKMVVGTGIAAALRRGRVGGARWNNISSP